MLIRSFFVKVNFCAEPKTTLPTFVDETKARVLYKNFIPENKTIYNPNVFVKEFDSLKYALNCLSQLTFDKKDLEKIKKYGATPIFANGAQALKLAKDNDIKIKFEKVNRDDIHAQWVNAENKIIINDRYKNTKNLAELYAISAAILHELSHAKDKDDTSSIQEELNCLAMNAIAFNNFRNLNPELFKGQNSPIIEDGVELYTNLFFGNDENALAQRIKLKYGDLPPTSPQHPASDFIKKHFINNNSNINKQTSTATTTLQYH